MEYRFFPIFDKLPNLLVLLLLILRLTDMKMHTFERTSLDYSGRWRESDQSSIIFPSKVKVQFSTFFAIFRPSNFQWFRWITPPREDFWILRDVPQTIDPTISYWLAISKNRYSCISLDFEAWDSFFFIFEKPHFWTLLRICYSWVVHSKLLPSERADSFL